MAALRGRRTRVKWWRDAGASTERGDLCVPVRRVGQAVNSAAVDLLRPTPICSHQVPDGHAASLVT